MDIARKEGIPLLIIDKENFFRGDGYTEELRERKIDLIILAGFLWKIPLALVQAYRGKIINIHPALLPKFGGKGMYGNHVHEAVIAAGEQQTGITIHYVDEFYDHGQIIFQAACEVEAGDTPETLGRKVHLLEYTHFAKIIEQEISHNLQNHR